MRFLDTAEVLALQARHVSSRDLFWMTVKNRSTGALVDFGFSTFARTAPIQVVNGRNASGAVSTRTYYGIHKGMSVSDVPLVADLTVRTMTIDLSAIDDQVQSMMRTYEPRGALVEVHRLLLDPDTDEALAPAKPRFVGYVDEAPITTPGSQGVAQVSIKCVSTTRELTRANTDVRSHDSQLARTGGNDWFYKDTAAVGNWEIYWGRNRGNTVPESKHSDRTRG